MCINIIALIYKFLEPMLILMGTLLAAIIAPLFGLLLYYRKREYELVRKRYLEEGIDILIKQIESIKLGYYYIILLKLE